MWKVDETLQGFLMAAHRLTLNVLNWAWKHKVSDAENDVNLLAELAGKACEAAPPLGVVAEKTDLCIYMAWLATSPHLAAIRSDYFRVTRDYRAFLAGGARQELDGPAREMAEVFFRYLYKHVLDSSTFWDQYSPERTEPISDKKGYREAFKRGRLVCPICDFTQTTVLSTSEHFLSQETFPVLAVYWLNLIVACPTCNSGARNEKFVGTRSGTSSYVPILHPFLDVVEKQVKFCFEHEYRPQPVPVGRLASDRIRAANYCKVYEIADRYAGLQGYAQDYVERMLERFTELFELQAEKHGRTRELLRQVAEDYIRVERRMLLKRVGEVDRTKFHLDLLDHIETQVNVLARKLGLA